eukprot:10567103-Lingulodinium_polyedra.AAC.1
MAQRRRDRSGWGARSVTANKHRVWNAASKLAAIAARGPLPRRTNNQRKRNTDRVDGTGGPRISNGDK